LAQARALRWGRHHRPRPARCGCIAEPAAAMARALVAALVLAASASPCAQATDATEATATGGDAPRRFLQSQQMVHADCLVVGLDCSKLSTEEKAELGTAIAEGIARVVSIGKNEVLTPSGQPGDVLLQPGSEPPSWAPNAWESAGTAATEGPSTGVLSVLLYPPSTAFIAEASLNSATWEGELKGIITRVLKSGHASLATTLKVEAVSVEPVPMGFETTAQPPPFSAGGDDGVAKPVGAPAPWVTTPQQDQHGGFRWEPWMSWSIFGIGSLILLVIVGRGISKCRDDQIAREEQYEDESLLHRRRRDRETPKQGFSGGIFARFSRPVGYTGH